MLALAAGGIGLTVVAAHGASPVATPLVTIGYTLLAIGFGSILVGVVVGGAPPLEARWLRAFGRYSYALYLLHFPILELSVRTRLGATLVHSRLGWAALTAAGLGASLGVAAVSWRFFEAPILRLKRYFKPRRAAAPVPVPEMSVP
jgi:peptidoglycan/LPS O-acetylase OafA/YrhL